MEDALIVWDAFSSRISHAKTVNEYEKNDRTSETGGCQDIKKLSKISNKISCSDKFYNAFLNYCETEWDIT